MINESPIATNVFEKELVLIKDCETRDFVISVFDEMCPNYFWYVPASVTSPGHPPVCRLRGGLVQHTKLAVTFADTFLDMLNIAPADVRYSQTIAATLLHDIMNRGATENDLETFESHGLATRNHGRYCAEQISMFMQLPPCSWPLIRAIELHMGQWTQDITDYEVNELKTNTVIRTTHLADYAASRPLHHYLAERHTDKSMEYLRS